MQRLPVVMLALDQVADAGCPAAAVPPLWQLPSPDARQAHLRKPTAALTPETPAHGDLR